MHKRMRYPYTALSYINSIIIVRNTNSLLLKHNNLVRDFVAGKRATTSKTVIRHITNIISEDRSVSATLQLQ